MLVLEWTKFEQNFEFEFILILPDGTHLSVTALNSPAPFFFSLPHTRSMATGRWCRCHCHQPPQSRHPYHRPMWLPSHAVWQPSLNHSTLGIIRASTSLGHKRHVVLPSLALLSFHESSSTWSTLWPPSWPPLQFACSPTSKHRSRRQIQTHCRRWLPLFGELWPSIILSSIPLNLTSPATLLCCRNRVRSPSSIGVPLSSKKCRDRPAASPSPRHSGELIIPRSCPAWSPRPHRSCTAAQATLHCRLCWW
jgi:hypothetical protein